VNKKVVMNSISGLIIGLGVLAAPTAIAAATPTATDECARELLLSYFPEPIVTDTLKKFNIPQEKWAGINHSLAKHDKEIVKLVEQKASAMNPNPLKDPQQRQAAVKLFRETLLQVFTDAMKENDVEDSSQYQAMLDEIQQQKAKKFALCMEKQKAQLQQNRNHDDSSNDNDDDDDEDDNDDKDDQESNHNGHQESEKNTNKNASKNNAGK